ncbi:MAG: cation-translocating P-type ATPase [Verrucomicrobia bacterium]|nr:cation-translocating P-type ATPase [Verrucomicrobiota bacterium]
MSSERGNQKRRDDSPFFFDTLSVDSEHTRGSGGATGSTRESRWLVSGMRCAGCASRLEADLRVTKGVLEAGVNFATGTATVLGGGNEPSLEKLQKVIEAAGFQCKLLSEMESDVAPADPAASARWVWAAIGFVPLSVFSMLDHFGADVFSLFHFQGRIWIEAVVSGAVVFGAASDILKSSWAALRRGAPDMDFLVGSGAVLAWSASFLAVWLGSAAMKGAYFEVAAGIVTFALFGRWLERNTRVRAGAAIKALAQLQPGTVRVEVDGGVQTCDIRDVRAGMVVQIAPGDRIPVDGVVIEGVSQLDESWVTGESVPVLRAAGARLIGGTLNGDGALRVRVSAGGRDTFLQQVLRIVREAQDAKPPVQRLADAVSGYFCLAVLVAAILTACIWALFGAPETRFSLAFWHGLSVLVVACPCALGLATPVAVLAGTGRAAQLGVLFRNGAALEILSKVQFVVLDKTGTLTFGRMKIVEWWERRSFEGRLLVLVAAAQKQSLHPAAGAVERRSLGWKFLWESRSGSRSPASFFRRHRPASGPGGSGSQRRESLPDGFELQTKFVQRPRRWSPR